MQFLISDERLEQIELEVAETNYVEFKKAEENRNFFCVLVSFLIWEIIFLTILFSFNLTLQEILYLL